MALKPVANYIVLLPPQRKAVSDGGVVLPDSHEEHPITGEVVAVGPQVTRVGVGERVFFAGYAGTYFTDETTKTRYLLLTEKEVLAVLTGEEESVPANA